MNGIKLGRQEWTVRLALNSNTIDDSDKKLLRNHLKLADSQRCVIMKALGGRDYEDPNYIYM